MYVSALTRGAKENCQTLHEYWSCTFVELVAPKGAVFVGAGLLRVARTLSLFFFFFFFFPNFFSHYTATTQRRRQSTKTEKKETC